MPESTASTSPARFGPLLIAFAVAAALVAVGWLITPERWAAIFQTDLAAPDLPHPPRPTALEGARLLRIMLFVTGPGVLVASLLLVRFEPKPKLRIEHRDSDSSELWIMAGLIVLGLLVRAARLGESLWYDEIAMLGDYAVRGPGWIVGTYFDPANHILATLLAWGSIEWLGADAFALRLPALLFSLLAVVPMYGLARRVGGTRTALLAGLLMAMLPVAALEGVEARGYSMMIFFATLGSWLLLSALREPNPWKWLAYALCCALGAWAHVTTVFVPLGHGLWIAWRAIRHKDLAHVVPAATALGLSAVVTVMLYAPVIPQMLSIRDTFASTQGDEPGLLGPEGFHALLQLGGSWSWWASIPGLVLMVSGLASAKENPPRRDALCITLIGMPLLMLLVTIANSWLYARFMLFALPGACLAIALGLETLWSRRRRIALLLLTLLLATSMVDLAKRPPKQPLREAANYVRNAASLSDRVLVIGLAHRVLELYRGDLTFAYSLHHGLDLPADLDRIHPAWVILMYPRHVSADHYALLDEQGFSLVHRLRGWADWGNGDILIYQKRSMIP